MMPVQSSTAPGFSALVSRSRRS
uniref:Uncharacterized protein n=1 Tax=Arundo donax TaxID=35708 RepID=A0A0A9AAV9_ARUDO